MPTRGQGLTPTENVGRGSSSAPHFLQSGLSVNPIKWRCLYRVLCPVRSQVTTLDCSLLRDKSLALVPRDQFPSLSLGRTKVLPSPCVLVHQPATNFTTQIPLRDPQNRLWAYKSTGRAIPREPVSCFIASHSSMPRDPIESHSMPGGDIIQCLLTLANQSGRCSDSP
jgi:hypothetical protein